MRRFGGKKVPEEGRIHGILTVSDALPEKDSPAFRNRQHVLQLMAVRVSVFFQNLDIDCHIREMIFELIQKILLHSIFVRSIRIRYDAE